ncbi:MAG: lysophospholipid acyltransferase family protein [Saprospiraceae bacterium]
MRVKHILTLFFTKMGIQLFRWVPFFCLYLLADLLFFLLKDIIKYRKKVIKANLSSSFPEKNAAEIDAIANLSYRNLCDITIESIKGLTLAKSSIQKRYKILNPEILDVHFNEGKSIILAGAHYCNWEWGVRSWSLWFKHQVMGIYKPLSNKTVEGYMNARREDLGMKLVGPKETRASLALANNTPCIFVLFGDQSPHNTSTCHWVNFLHHDTPWLQGVGEIAFQNDFPVYYLETTRVRRGYYESTLITIVQSPLDYSPQQISALYAHQVEENIRLKPEDWLWSHKRWKHQR